MSLTIPFTKMQGIGNDFVVIDALQHSELPANLPEFARKVNDRRFGIGGDGLILLEPGESAPFRMRMFNPDGSESEMCGNGIRCFGRLLQDHKHLNDETVRVETGAGTLTLEMLGPGRFRVDMGQARLTRGEIGMVGPSDQLFTEVPVGSGYAGTAVSMGNPHLVIFVDDVAKVELETVGPVLEHHPEFPKRTNVHFIQVVDRDHLIQRTWERGAGITLACGTGACASAVAAFVTGRANRKVEIRLPGGKLEIEYLEDGRVLMTGPAESVFEGEIEV
ncbi:MAG: diaminopimelate epimerase [Fimbriimonas sp.]|nr:diaminopimelate epimerase [Fimbriimonas sp.]